MSLIEQLIQMKRSEEENDIIKMIDEFTLYEKLSTVKALGDIKDSEALQKRLPYMTRFIHGDFYQVSLAIMANHILNHMEYESPELIQKTIANIPERTMKQLTLASASTVKPTFQELMEYDHETEEEFIVGVYTNEIDNETKIIIITNPSGKEYIIYQGSYVQIDGENLRKRNQSTIDHKDYIQKLNNGILSIGNYSMAGNNHYPFAEYIKEGITYYLSMPTQSILQLSTRENLAWEEFIDEHHKREIIYLTHEETNQIGLSRQDIDGFSQVISDIINRWEDER